MIQLENACKNPAPLQPAQTHNKVTNKLFFVSNEKFVCHMISEGRGFSFCDNFSPEILYVVTQTGTDITNVETRV